MTRISVVTVCYNAAEFIETTLRSVLNQDHEDLEYIVIDGGSTDGTQEIIERYVNKLSFFVSEKDGGQYEAIQKGLSRSTGEVMCFLNADDIYMPWTFSVVDEIFASNFDVEWIIGQPGFMNRRGQIVEIYAASAAYPRHFVANGWYNRILGGFLQQESMFWRRSLWDKTTGLDLSLHFAADYKLWTSFAQHANLVAVSLPLAAFRKLPGEQRSSTCADIYDAEVAQVMQNLQQPPKLWKWISRRGLVARNLMRVLIRHHAPVILYDETIGQWRKIITRRSIARISFRELLQKRILKSKKKELDYGK